MCIYKDNRIHLFYFAHCPPRGFKPILMRVSAKAETYLTKTTCGTKKRNTDCFASVQFETYFSFLARCFSSMCGTSKSLFFQQLYPYLLIFIEKEMS